MWLKLTFGLFFFPFSFKMAKNTIKLLKAGLIYQILLTRINEEEMGAFVVGTECILWPL